MTCCDLNGRTQRAEPDYFTYRPVQDRSDRYEV